MPASDAKWGGDSGLLDDFDLDFAECEFRSTEFGTQFVAKGPAVGPDGEGIEEHELFLSCGKRFSVMEGGARVVHDSGNEQKGFNKNSAMQEFIDRALKLGAPLKTNGAGDPSVASTYQGLRFHIKLDERKNTMEGATKDTFLRAIPTAYNGLIGQSSSGSSASVPAASASAASNGSGDVRKAELFATTTDDYFSFLEKATGEFGFSPKDPRVAESGSESLWAAAKA